MLLCLLKPKCYSATLKAAEYAHSKNDKAGTLPLTLQCNSLAVSTSSKVIIHLIIECSEPNTWCFFFLQPIMVDIKRERKAESTDGLSRPMRRRWVHLVREQDSGWGWGGSVLYFSLLVFLSVVYVMISILSATVRTFWMNSYEMKWKTRREIIMFTRKRRGHAAPCWAKSKLTLQQTGCSTPGKLL